VVDLSQAHDAGTFFEVEENVLGECNEREDEFCEDNEGGDELVERAAEDDGGARRVERHQQQNCSKRAMHSIGSKVRAAPNISN